MAQLLWQFPEVGVVSCLGPTELFVEAVGDAEVQKLRGGYGGRLIGWVGSHAANRYLLIGNGVETCGWSIRAG